MSKQSQKSDSDLKTNPTPTTSTSTPQIQYTQAVKKDLLAPLSTHKPSSPKIQNSELSSVPVKSEMASEIVNESFARQKKRADTIEQFFKLPIKKMKESTRLSSKQIKPTNSIASDDADSPCNVQSSQILIDQDTKIDPQDLFIEAFENDYDQSLSAEDLKEIHFCTEQEALEMAPPIEQYDDFVAMDSNGEPPLDDSLPYVPMPSRKPIKSETLIKLPEKIDEVPEDSNDESLLHSDDTNSSQPITIIPDAVVPQPCILPDVPDKVIPGCEIAYYHQFHDSVGMRTLLNFHHDVINNDTWSISMTQLVESIIKMMKTVTNDESIKIENIRIADHQYSTEMHKIIGWRIGKCGDTYILFDHILFSYIAHVINLHQLDQDSAYQSVPLHQVMSFGANLVWSRDGFSSVMLTILNFAVRSIVGAANAPNSCMNRKYYKKFIGIGVRKLETSHGGKHHSKPYVPVRITDTGSVLYNIPWLEGLVAFSIYAVPVLLPPIPENAPIIPSGYVRVEDGDFFEQSIRVPVSHASQIYQTSSPRDVLETLSSDFPIQAKKLHFKASKFISEKLHFSSQVKYQFVTHLDPKGHLFNTVVLSGAIHHNHQKYDWMKIQLDSILCGAMPYTPAIVVARELNKYYLLGGAQILANSASTPRIWIHDDPNETYGVYWKRLMPFQLFREPPTSANYIIDDFIDYLFTPSFTFNVYSSWTTSFYFENWVKHSTLVAVANNLPCKVDAEGEISTFHFEEPPNSKASWLDPSLQIPRLACRSHHDQSILDFSCSNCSVHLFQVNGVDVFQLTAAVNQYKSFRVKMIRGSIHCADCTLVFDSKLSAHLHRITFHGKNSSNEVSSVIPDVESASKQVDQDDWAEDEPDSEALPIASMSETESLPSSSSDQSHVNRPEHLSKSTVPIFDVKKSAMVGIPIPGLDVDINALIYQPCFSSSDAFLGFSTESLQKMSNHVVSSKAPRQEIKMENLSVTAFSDQLHPYQQDLEERKDVFFVSRTKKAHIPDLVDHIGGKKISRAYFKFAELDYHFDLIPNEGDVLMVGEAPGGYAQRVLERGCKVFAQSIKSSECYFHKSLYDNGNFQPLDILDGNLLDRDTRVCTALSVGKVTLFSGDAAIAVPTNQYRQQEHLANPLFIAQILLGLDTLDVGGNMVIKHFSFSTSFSKFVVAALTESFDEVYIAKPTTSKITNDERYLVCKRKVSDHAQNILTDASVHASSTLQYPYSEDFEKWYDATITQYFAMASSFYASVDNWKELDYKQWGGQFSDVILKPSDRLPKRKHDLRLDGTLVKRGDETICCIGQHFDDHLKLDEALSLLERNLDDKKTSLTTISLMQKWEIQLTLTKAFVSAFNQQKITHNDFLNYMSYLI